ncbi:hypothetical protein LSH36_845g02107 [Paralvinella palmiformis]|uniref:EF-hand domain-containing protein n=1 Tax=Paralvinella palmiformis TaxID=53620 RepID=A0AAD9J0I7_9ANNE|nr:hypothetical protein LSH36_845g02107 [Paralvinella palmiformis]
MKSSFCLKYVIITLGVAIVMGHVQVLEDEEDFEDDYEDYDYTSDHKPKLKKPLPEAKNPLHEKRQFVQDRGHIKEHIKYPDINIESADDSSVEFHFFKTHDFNEDNHLDGLELWKAIEHSMEKQISKIVDDSKLSDGSKKRRVARLYLQLEGTVDKILHDDDRNRDGYLSYSEFANARITVSFVTQSNVP